MTRPHEPSPRRTAASALQPTDLEDPAIIRAISAIHGDAHGLPFKLIRIAGVIRKDRVQGGQEILFDCLVAYGQGQPPAHLKVLGIERAGQWQAFSLLD